MCPPEKMMWNLESQAAWNTTLLENRVLTEANTFRCGHWGDWRLIKRGALDTEGRQCEDTGRGLRGQRAAVMSYKPRVAKAAGNPQRQPGPADTLIPSSSLQTGRLFSLLSRSVCDLMDEVRWTSEQP